MTRSLSSHGLDLGKMQERADALIKAALKAGADAADTLIVSGRSLSISLLNGKLEENELSEGDDLGLRVFVGKKQAIVSGHDADPQNFAAFAERAIAMAKATPDDRFAGLPDTAGFATNIPDLDLFDGTHISGEQLIALAKEAEDAALSVTGVSKSGGANASTSHGVFVLQSSNGFNGSYASSHYSISATAIAGDGTDMERDYDYSSCRYFSDLRSTADIGRRAGERTARRINPQKIPSGKRKIMFDQRVASSLVSHLAAAINGASIVKKTSFLKDRLGTKIFNDGIIISDEPHRVRGHRSRPFDAEGSATKTRNIIDNGALTTWLLDTVTARELGLQTTGHADRGVSSRPSPSSSNMILQPGQVSVEQMMRDIGNGLLVTDLIGRGANLITGDYSCGCSGFLIENGIATKAVSEITIAGSLSDIFAALTPANDLDIHSSISAPSCYIGELMVAGL